jgi:hypothetical protein
VVDCLNAVMNLQVLVPRSLLVSNFDSDMVMKFLCGRKQSNNSDREDNVNAGCDMQHGT